jgi:hypothetical protein
VIPKNFISICSDGFGSSLWANLLIHSLKDSPAEWDESCREADQLICDDQLQKAPSAHLFSVQFLFHFENSLHLSHRL